MDNYEDIINLPHHVSSRHPQMSMRSRAAQFSPFAALTGHAAAIAETARVTEKQDMLDEDELRILNQKINELLRNASSNPSATYTYFIPDARKEGGHYTEVTGVIREIKQYEKCIILQDGTKIPFSAIKDIQIND